MGKKVLKIVALLFCVIAIVAIAQYAFAKFRDAFNANTEAEVAKWSFKVNGSTDEVQTFNLIETMDENSTVTEGMIAPGTSGSFNLEVDTTTTETDLTYTIEIELENKPENMRFYADSEFKKEYPVIDNKITINENILLEENEPIRNTTIYWNWELITGNTEEEFLENDEIDSESMGQTIIANATVTGVQLEPESTGVSFTVYDYLENEDDTGYSLYGTRTITGLTETEVTLTKIATTINNASYGFGRLTPDGEQVDNISLAEDGSTVVYLYYQLDDYTITYDLQDGSLKSSEYNPLSYNKNTKSFTLHNPTKEGYIFLGWTGGVVDENGDIDDTANPGATPNVTEPTESLTVATGSFGNRKYTANWRSIGYIVNVHHYLAETGPEFGTEPISLAKDELLTSQVLGESYETYDLIPTLDSEGNITETDGREYLDANEMYFVSDSGNTTGVYTEDEINVYYYYQYYPVVKIVSSPATTLNGTEYTSIAKAMQALENAGLNVSSEQSSLVLLKDIKDESALIENQNIQLDLAGFTLNSSSETEPTIELDNSKVVLVDNSDAKTGKVVSQNTVGVYISTDSEFTLGIEDETINTSPSIEANTKGIETEKTDSAEGIFNFFDGTITATTAIDGTVNLTPLLYSATVTVNENNQQVSTLGIVSGVEARIGRKTYLLLEDAIEDANTEINTDGSQVEIVVVQDLSKEAAVVVDETKNIKLDLDGHTITTTASDYVLKNYGTLEIVDSTADSENLAGTGKIVSTTNSVIYNDATGSLTIRAGTIGLEKVGTSSSYKTAIVNNGELYIGPEAVVEDETGSESEVATVSEESEIATISETEVSNIRPYIYSNKKYTNLIYGSGNTTVENGSFYSSASSGYGIRTTGNVVINDGTYNTYTNAVSLTSSATADKTVEINGGTFEEVILNESAGKIIINNGTFNDSVSVSNTNSVIQINNGTFTGAISASRGTVEINNGTFSGKVSLSNSATVNVNDGTFNGGFSNYSSSKVNINGGTINSSISNGSGTMNINNATINYTGGNAISNGATLYIDKGTTITTTKGNPIENDEDGTVYLKECTINCEAAYYGVANSGVLVLGDNDEEISTEYPLINAIYGISNTTGTLKFYDGKIISNTGLTIRGNINELPENCEVLITVEDSKEIATVGEPSDPVAKIGETTYSTLQSAVDAVPTDSTNTKIELLKDVYLSETVTIPENKNITLDLMQYTIKGLHTGYVLDNSGILEIDSSSENTLPSVNISNKVDKANYYFVEQNGTLVSNNAGIKSTTANSYIPIDLTGLTGKYELNVNAQISSEINGDIGYATIRQSTSVPSYSSSDGRFMYISGKVPATEYTTTLTGGNVYYLHLGYYKGSSVDSYNDIFTINNISIYPKGSILSYAKHNLINNTNKLSLNKADINLYAEGTSSSYLSVIENTGELKMNSGSMGTSTNSYTMSVNNKESGSVVINGGTLANTSSSQYCIQSSSSNNITVNGGLINFYNYGVRNTSTGDVIVNNGRFNTSNSGGYGIYSSNEEGQVTINNGHFKGYERLISINYGKLIMNDGFLQDSTSTSSGYAAIEIHNNASGEIYNGTIYSRYEAIGITASTGNVKIDNGEIISNAGNTIENAGNLEIVNGKIYAKSTSTRPAIQNTGTATIHDGYFQGAKRGITNSGTMTVLGGKIYGNSEIGIYTTGTLTIGTKDGNVSTESPYIYGKTYGLSLGSSTVNFYDGKIEGASSQSISGTPTSIEDGYEIVKTVDSTTSRETAILDIMPIAQVGTEQYYTLQEAFDACSDGVQTEVTILRNANIIQTTESATISENKDIILNLNGYEVVAGNDNTIIVEGKLQITDTAETAGTMKNTAGSLILMQGAGELTVSAVTLQETVAKNLITNNGTGNITVVSGNLIATTAAVIENNADSKITLNGGTIQSLSGTSTSSGTGISLNAGDLEINEGATISTNGNSVYVNNSSSEVIINGGTLGILYNNAAKLEDSQVANVTINAGDLKQIYNNAAGEIIVNNVTMDTGKEAVVNVSNGNIIVNTATITSYYDTFINEGGGIIDIKDGTYTATYGGNCIYNSNGTINIENGTFTATEYSIIGNGNSSTSGDCIMNINGGTFNQTYSEATTAIANGYRYGSDYTVEMNITKATITSRAGDGIKNYAKLTLGANDGVNNDADISITGNLYGVINIGTFNYYDGTIKASLNKSIYKTINDIPENAEIVYTKDTTTETATLANENVARIGETYYNSLSEAIKACSTTATESTTITLLKDIGIGGTGYEVKAGQNIILDLNGYRLNQFNVITNNGDFEITDSTESKTGTIDVSNRMINNYSNFKMSAGNIYSYMFSTDSTYLGESIGTRSIIYNYENGNVELANVSLYNKVVGQGTSNIIYSISQNNVKLINSTIETDGWYYNYDSSRTNVIYCNASSGSTNVEIENTNITHAMTKDSAYAIYINTSASVTMNSGTIGTFDYAIYNSDYNNTGDINLNGGTIESDILINSANNVTLDGASISATRFQNCNDVVINSGTCTSNLTIASNNSLTINGGTMSNTVQISYTPTTINGGTIDNITIANSEVLMLGGEVNHADGAGITLSSGTLTLGVKEYPVSTTEPVITGSTYGVVKSGGTFNYYDGVITGTGNGAISGTVDSTPELYTVSLAENGTVATLAVEATFEQVAIMNGVYYDSLQQAINAAGTTASTITLEKDNVMLEGLTIAENQNITLDLNGYSISTVVVENAYAITNSGTLTIVDTALTEDSTELVSKVRNYTGTAIKNDGTLTIGVDDSVVLENIPTIVGTDYGIENNGVLNVYDGKVEGIKE